MVRQKLRTELDRDEDSTVAIADSQSVKTTEKSAPPALRFPQLKDGASKALSTAHDGGKKVKGRKRHIVVDS
ncbi:transposase [Okeania sp. KiyG1]|uniref:transposase n=1 Tax=Okeania sp. KiyG1 TaxID=2720165 RepID=UPI0035C8FC52